MIISFLNTHLELPEKTSERITEGTPQLAFIKSHRSDIEKEMGALFAIIEGLENINFIVDAMAGSGFSGRILQRQFSNCHLHLNDMDEGCVKALKDNFPTSIVTNERAEDLSFTNRPDIIFVDFNNFTLNKMNIWKNTFKMVFKHSPKWFIFTDSTSYAFKFKRKLQRDTYYPILNDALKKEGWGINKVAIFGNASLVLCSESFQGEIKYLKSFPIHYSINKYKGML